MTDKLRDDRAAIEKAVSILVAFGEQAHVGLGVSEIARRTGLSKSTAFRVLAVLERNLMVERAGSAYRLGGLLHELGSRVYAPTSDLLREALTPHLADLYEATHHTVQLATLHGSEVVYLNGLCGHPRATVPARTGGRAPAHSTAIGKILLAFDPAALDGIAAQPLRARTPRTITDPIALGRQLAAARRTGVAYDDGESAEGVRSIAAPVLDSRRRAVAAMSISGGGDFSPQSVEHVLRAACFAASRTLGRAVEISAA